MNLSKEEVLKALCQLCTKVGQDRFKSREAYNCFCEKHFWDPGDYQFSEEVLEFVVEAVEQALERKKEQEDEEW